MQNSENLTPRSSNRASLFIDYLPAELRKGKDWIIVYYSKNPLTKQNTRYRVRVPKIKNAKAREQTAKKMCAQINERLQNGWIPELERQEKFYTRFSDV